MELGVFTTCYKIIRCTKNVMESGAHICTSTLFMNSMMPALSIAQNFKSCMLKVAVFIWFGDKYDILFYIISNIMHNVVLAGHRLYIIEAFVE